MADIKKINLHTLLDSVRTTLVNLKLKFHPRCETMEAIPENLENLQNLTLNGYKGSLAFVYKTRNLKFLKLVRINLPKVLETTPIVGKESSTVRRLEIFEEYSNRVGSKDVENLTLWFPQLQRLKLENVDDGGISKIFAFYSQLTHLDLVNGFYGDAGVTGFSNGLKTQPGVSDLKCK